MEFFLRFLLSFFCFKLFFCLKVFTGVSKVVF